MMGYLYYKKGSGIVKEFFEFFYTLFITRVKYTLYAGFSIITTFWQRSFVNVKRF